MLNLGLYKYLFAFTIALLSILSTDVVFAAPACEGLFGKAKISSKRVAKPDGIQEAIWSLRSQGNLKKALELESRLEDILLNDEILNIELLGAVVSKLGDEPGSRENTYLITFRSGVQAVGKDNKQREDSNTSENEIAASIVDRLFHINRVPLTVRRIVPYTVRGRVYPKSMSLQFFMVGLRQGGERALNLYSPRARLFDFLINYSDGRRQAKSDNYLLTHDGREILIDNESGFHTRWEDPKKSLDRHVVQFLKSLQFAGVKPREAAPDKEVFERLKQVSPDEIRAALNGVIHVKEIEYLIMRRDAYVKYMQRYITVLNP